ncbi:MAG: CbrC family protein [Bacteroidota bacterium]|nr:CbrC family protein [Bacteroidota bacterium]
MEFKYFKGPTGDMDSFIEQKTVCSICGNENDCFELEFSITQEFNDDDKEGKAGCIDCLKKGLFEFWHDTEFGVLDENGLTKVYNHNVADPSLIAEQVLEEMRRTPRIEMWQQERWLTHCSDFMIYMGIWTPKDFYTNSKDGNGRQLFMDMTDVNENHLWDDSLGEGETELEEWYPMYYVFECSHCGKLRGNWDCD